MRGSDFAQIDTIRILHALMTPHEAVAGLDGVSLGKCVRSAVSGSCVVQNFGILWRDFVV